MKNAPSEASAFGILDVGCSKNPRNPDIEVSLLFSGNRNDPEASDKSTGSIPPPPPNPTTGLTSLLTGLRTVPLTVMPLATLDVSLLSILDDFRLVAALLEGHLVQLRPGFDEFAVRCRSCPDLLLKPCVCLHLLRSLSPVG